MMWSALVEIGWFTSIILFMCICVASTLVAYVTERLLFLLPLRCWTRFIRHLNIRKAGWPPPHLDADGDFRPESQMEPCIASGEETEHNTLKEAVEAYINRRLVKLPESCSHHFLATKAGYSPDARVTFAYEPWAQTPEELEKGQVMGIKKQMYITVEER